MSINVKLEVFEGPLDLLLHLIEKSKLNIYDIPISAITDQYLDYQNGNCKVLFGLLERTLYANNAQ